MLLSVMNNYQIIWVKSTRSFLMNKQENINHKFLNIVSEMITQKKRKIKSFPHSMKTRYEWIRSSVTSVVYTNIYIYIFVGCFFFVFISMHLWMVLFDFYRESRYLWDFLHSHTRYPSPLNAHVNHVGDFFWSPASSMIKEHRKSNTYFQMDD